ncbi:MAG: adenylate kinase [Saprospiraceae bacterium]|nr:adenylate kinase [Saprospiraceae bacterium]
MLNVALFGPPGAGKGTQSQYLIEKYNLTYISTGDILRKEIADRTKLGMQAKNIIEQGGLVDDELIVQILERKLMSLPNSNGVLFDGFPRTVVQAYILEGLLLKLNTSLTCMLSLEVPREELIARLLNRGKMSGRSDDNIDVIENRLHEYDEKTVPVAKFYQDIGKYIPINGVGKIEDIFVKLNDEIQNTLEKKWLNVVIQGYPGAGKDTQAKKLSKQYNLVYISTGEMLRDEIARNTEIGKIVKPYMDKGDFVPDEIPIRLIERKINENPDSKGFIFKGFPKNLVQAYILDGLLERFESSVSCMIRLEVSALEAMKRLYARNKTPQGRSYDADSEVIIRRLEEFETKTYYVADYYKKMDKFYSINGMGDEKEIADKLSILVKTAFKNVR